ncbi:carbohydrate ABC transporter permease [Tuberibacillus sp. Marseille-P3662]|uniref:carbohydrate ABC transporter permease n=1 Tax=Tuberibacillus sp. Marseille-P3662 TaxID=1965358 RepID=UPI000A1CA857|nr:sugar ABC transporter permease [Tuberibacillus sp. Marseille-P3662]
MAALRRNLTAYGFLMPWLLGLLVLTLGSFFFSIYLAFTHYDLLSAPQWAGLSNFKKILSDELFYTSLKVTILYVVVSVPLRLIFSLLVAVLLNRDIKGIGIYRALFYVPSLIGTSVGVAIMWRNIFSDEGLVNDVLGMVGIEGVSWISDPRFAIYVICLLSVWQFGSEMIIFLAGLKQVPETLYEAAAIDGASKIGQFFHVTVPMVSPLIFFNLVMGTINAFMVFTQGYIITEGGPINSTLFYVLYLFRQGFEYFNMGYAAALACIFLVIISVFAGFLFLTSKFWVHYE